MLPYPEAFHADRRSSSLAMKRKELQSYLKRSSHAHAGLLPVDATSICVCCVIVLYSSGVKRKKPAVSTFATFGARSAAAWCQTVSDCNKTDQTRMQHNHRLQNGRSLRLPVDP